MPANNAEHGSTGLGIFEGLVEKILVLSLPNATDRRDRLPGHLSEFGISNFEWHDAYLPDNPEVTALYDLNLVASFPPCFRCGKNNCDCENNALIPPQVANFASYLAIWKRIRDEDHRVLVLEDDVFFHPWAPRVARKLKKQVANGKIDFQPETPMLLRLGWAKNNEHRPFRLFKTTHQIHMSNPCHALTPAYAGQLLEAFSEIGTTSDVFVNEIVADEKNSLTIQPPLASELSWSVGSLDSHIHPKESHLEYLKERGLEDQQAEHELRLRQHVQHIFSLPILCVGHPRTGTGYVAELCTRAGLDVGHEKGGADGISSWMFAVDADENPWALDQVGKTRRALHWETMIQTVRDPETAIPSIMRENRHAPASYEFRRTHILELTGVNLDDFETEIEQAIASLCLWASIIREQKPDFVFHIEHDAEALIDYLCSKGFDVSKDKLDIGPVNAEKLYKGVHHEKPRVDRVQWERLGPVSQNLLAEYCDLYGYENPTKPEL